MIDIFGAIYIENREECGVDKSGIITKAVLEVGRDDQGKVIITQRDGYNIYNLNGNGYYTASSIYPSIC